MNKKFKADIGAIGGALLGSFITSITTVIYEKFNVKNIVNETLAEERRQLWEAQKRGQQK